MIKTGYRFRLTSFGKVALFLAIFLFFAAQNTGNNLLYLMSACFLTSIVLFALVAFRNISGISANLQVTEPSFAGEELSLKCKLKDTSNRDHFCLGFGGDYILTLPLNEVLVLKMNFKPERRGCHRLHDFCVFSFYPFGLFCMSIVAPPLEIPVGPAPGKVGGTLMDTALVGVVQKFQAGKEGEYWMQKHYEAGEDAGLINWTISARSDTEWILLKTIDYGFPEKLYFDFSRIDKNLFEDCLKLVMGVLLKLKTEGSGAFVWAKSKGGSFNWLSIGDNFSDLVAWLAEIEPDDEVCKPSGDYEGIDFAELMGSENG